MLSERFDWTEKTHLFFFFCFFFFWDWVSLYDFDRSITCFIKFRLALDSQSFTYTCLLSTGKKGMHYPTVPRKTHLDCRWHHFRVWVQTEYKGESELSNPSLSLSLSPDCGCSVTTYLKILNLSLPWVITDCIPKLRVKINLPALSYFC